MSTACKSRRNAELRPLTKLTAALALLLFLLVSQLHGHQDQAEALGLAGGSALLQTGTGHTADAPDTADLCAVCVALNSARPQNVFVALPPTDAAVAREIRPYRFEPDRGWHAPLSCRPPPASA